MHAAKLVYKSHTTIIIGFVFMFCALCFLIAIKISGINRRIFARSERSNYWNGKKASKRTKEKKKQITTLHYNLLFYKLCWNSRSWNLNGSSMFVCRNGNGNETKSDEMPGCNWLNAKQCQCNEKKTTKYTHTYSKRTIIYIQHHETLNKDKN